MFARHPAGAPGCRRARGCIPIRGCPGPRRASLRVVEWPLDTARSGSSRVRGPESLRDARSIRRAACRCRHQWDELLDRSLVVVGVIYATPSSRATSGTDVSSASSFATASFGLPSSMSLRAAFTWLSAVDACGDWRLGNKHRHFTRPQDNAEKDQRRRQARERLHGACLWVPEPSLSVCDLSIARAVHVSSRPFGQRTSRRSMAVDDPRPKCSRKSLCE